VGIITITNLNDGINVKADPSAISDGAMEDCVGFDLTKDGIIQTAGGLATHDLALPTGTIQWQDILYIGSTKYVLATTSVGLYANGTLVRSGFTGRFKGVSFLNNIFLVNGAFAIRFDGTTCFQWGITAPTTVPTISVGTYLSKVIDSFDSLATWIANQVNCTVSAEAIIKKEGTQSAHFQVAASTRGYSYRSLAQDLTTFTTGEASSVKDYVRFWLYVDNLANLEELVVFVDVGDGTFASDYFSFSVVSPGTEAGIQAFGLGKTADVIAEETVVVPAGSTLTKTTTIPGRDLFTGYVPAQVIEEPYTTEHDTTIVTKTITKTIVDPLVTDQVLAFWRRNALIQLKSATWVDVKIPKSMFIQNGDFTKTWATKSSIKIEVAATSNGAVNCYIDNLRIVGGSDLSGDYWFTYAYARLDSSYNILHESPPSRANKQVNIIGPVSFDREPLAYSNRPLSSDPQVNGAILGILGGSLGSFWVLTQFNDNTTTSGVFYNIGDSTAIRIIHSQHNEPAPAGTDLVLHQNKIWMIGDSAYSRYLRSSDILADGTLAPEGWPTRNAYDLENNKGSLTHITLLNEVPLIKGTSGEWFIQVLDPTDYFQVKSRQVSNIGLIGENAVIEFPNSNVYASASGFVETFGQPGRTQYILPEIEPIIDSNMASAVAIRAGLVNYFSYKSNLTGDRTAKIDLFKGKPRFSNINNKLLESLSLDEITNKVYGVYSGSTYLIDSGTQDTSIPSGELTLLLKSKAYGVSSLTVWNRMELIHNTGGVWYILHIYIDNILRASMPFNSTSRTAQNFRDFGPCSGYTFQFMITGTTTQSGTLHFPIRIYYGGK
jgi:hypothetical protein